MPQKALKPVHSPVRKQEREPIATQGAGHSSPSSDQLGLERLIFFSDAVFAIAITLLALEIRLPSVENRGDNAALLNALLGNAYQYLAYVISFLVIGSFWLAHHRKFRLVRLYDRRLLQLNLLMLMVVAFLPFPSSLLSEYGNMTSTVFYAITVILAALLTMAVWRHATRGGLLDPNADPQDIRREFLSPVVTCIVFTLSIGIAFLDVNLARLSWLLILVIAMIPNRRYPF